MEIEALTADATAKDPVQLQALREMVAFLDGKLDLGEARSGHIHDLANCDCPIEGILCNDENSSDEELIDHLVTSFDMRRIEAFAHVARRDYQRKILSRGNHHARQVLENATEGKQPRRGFINSNSGKSGN